MTRLSKATWVFGLLVTALLQGCGGSDQPGAGKATSPAGRQPSSLYMSSSAFDDGQLIPNEYTCDGSGKSPPLQWNDAPANTASFAVVLEDPDAPGGTFRHWGVYDIAATTHQLAAGAAAGGALKQTKNDFGRTGYGAPCPPKGDNPHRYRFRVMALDIAQLPAPPSTVDDLVGASRGHVLGTAELTGSYGR